MSKYFAVILTLFCLLLCACNASNSATSAVPAVAQAAEKTLPSSQVQVILENSITSDDLHISGVHLGDGVDDAVVGLGIEPHFARMSTEPNLRLSRSRINMGRMRETEINFDGEEFIISIVCDEPDMVLARGLTVGSTMEEALAALGEPQERREREPYSEGEAYSRTSALLYECDAGFLVLSISYDLPATIERAAVYRHADYSSVMQWTLKADKRFEPSYHEEVHVQVLQPVTATYSRSGPEPLLLSVVHEGSEPICAPLLKGRVNEANPNMFVGADTLDIDDYGSNEIVLYGKYYLCAFRPGNLSAIAEGSTWELFHDVVDGFLPDGDSNISYEVIGIEPGYYEGMPIIVYTLVFNDHAYYPSFPFGEEGAVPGFASIGLAVRGGEWVVVNSQYYPIEGGGNE